MMEIRWLRRLRFSFLTPLERVLANGINENYQNGRISRSGNFPVVETGPGLVLVLLSENDNI